MNCPPNQHTFSFRFLEKEDEFKAPVLKPTCFSNEAFLHFTEEICPQMEHKIIEVKNEGNLLGYLYYQIMPFKGNELKSYIPQSQECILSKTVEAIVNLALERVNWSLGVLGNVFITGDNGQYWTSTVPDAVRWEAIRKADKFLAKNLQIDAFLISDLRAKDLEGHEQMIARNYRYQEVEPDLIFDIDSEWVDFQDYLGSIVSKYRVRTNKVLEKSAALRVEDLNLETLDQQKDSLYQLYKNVVASAAFKLAEIPPNYFYDFKKAYPDNFKVRAFYLEDKIVGLISFFIGEETLHINFVGLDYDFNKANCIYQRILYDCIDQGIKLHKQQIHFGRTASEIKTSVGAYPVKAYSLLKHNNKLPNMAIKPLTNYMKPEPFEVRSPFKNKKVS